MLLFGFLLTLRPAGKDLLMQGSGSALIALGLWTARAGFPQIKRWVFGLRDDLDLSDRWWHRLAKVILAIVGPGFWFWSLGSSESFFYANVSTALITLIALNIYNRAVLY